MKITNSLGLLVLSGLIVSCAGGGTSANVDKTFESADAFDSMISKEQNSISSGTETQKQQGNQQSTEPEQQKPEAQNQQPSKPLTEEEVINKKKLEYFQQLSDKDFIKMKCNSNGCVSIMTLDGYHNTISATADYSVDKDSIKPFKPDTTLSGTTTYKSDTIVKTIKYGNEIKDHKGKIELNIDNKTGLGNAKTSIENIASNTRDINKADITYNNIDYTKEKFESSDITAKIYTRNGGATEINEIHGNIEGSLSGESNSIGKFNADITDSHYSGFKAYGVFSGDKKEVNKDGKISTE